jgi:hypothetical protein
MASWTEGSNPKLQLESSIDNRFTFRTIPVPAHSFKYQKIQAPTGSVSSDITVKIKAVLHRVDDPYAQPIVMIATYEPDAVDAGTGNWPEPPQPATINVTESYEFDGNYQEPVQYGFIGEATSISTPSQITKNGKTYNFAGWNDGNTSNPRTITPQGNEAYTAIYKYVNHSNTSATFANSSQKKFISAGYFYKVYTSINNIWLEKSGDCVNWSIVGNSPVNDLSEGPEAKSPAIDFVTTNGGISYNIYVTYQQKTSNGKYKIKVAKFNDIGQKMFNLDVFTSTMDYSAFDAAPVIAVSHSYSLASNKPKFLIVWRQQAEGSYQSGLYYYGGIDNGNNATLYYLPPQKFTSTDAQSSNPTIAVYKNPVGSILNHVAWQQGTSQIKYRGIADNWNHDDLGGLSEYGSLESPSTGIVLSCNTNPSITVINSNATPEYSYDSPKLAWKASFCGQDYSAAFRDKNNSQYGTTWNNFHLYWSNDGSEINSININSTEYDNYFAFVYSEAAYPTTTNKYVKSTNLSSIQSLNSHFRDLQISNAPEGWMGMNIITFNNSTVPYTFSNAGVILLKNNNLPSEARGCSIIKDYAGFYFNFGDVSINGKSIEFKEKDDTVRTESSQLINKFMQTQPFSISENSSLVYYVSYGVNDSSAVKYELSNDEFINYNLVLIDNITGEILGTLLNINQSKNLIENKKNIGYKVNISNIGNREVVLKLIEKDNLNGEYSFLKIHGSENLIMQKSSFEEISLNSNNPIKNYSLNQNYPNPFNPSTNIHYELPNNGLVTLKVYDELGREVKTLVNQYQTKGRYDINFNADNLASGIYFYRLQSGNFISTKKMLLLK